MVQFPFRVNKSFRRYVRHPITVRMGVLAQLLAEGLDEDDVSIIAPDGQQFSGAIYHSHNNHCEYYQIVVRGGYHGDTLSQSPIGLPLSVEISRTGGRVLVRLVRR